jgi:hypothetical protein
MILIACSTSPSYGATISGTVKGPEGAALNGVFVQAQNNKTNMTFMAIGKIEFARRTQARVTAQTSQLCRAPLILP